MATKNEKITNQIADINKLLSSAIPSLGLAMGAINMIRDMFRRHESGEAAATFEQNVAIIEAGSTLMQERSAEWLAAHPEYDPKTGKKL